MSWPTWNQAAVVAVLALLVAHVLRRHRSDSARCSGVATACQEFAFMAGVYSIWRIARQLPLTRVDGAFARARRIVEMQEALHLPSELSMQQLVIDNDWLSRVTTGYYAGAHVPALVAFLVWLYVRHREDYPHWRNALVLVTAACLVIRFVRVAPPRFLPDLGYVDLSLRYGLDVYGSVDKGVSDQFAAMPSIHVAWAAIVSLGVFTVCTAWWRWLFFGHLALTCFVVVASGNHWWLDGIVSLLLLALALGVDTRARRSSAQRRPATGSLAPPVETVDPLPVSGK